MSISRFRRKLTAWPASLGDEDGLSSRDPLCLPETGPEIVGGLLNGVGSSFLEVRKCIVA